MKDSFGGSGGQPTSRLVARLASSPLLVVGVTLAIGVAVTGVLMIVGHMDSVAIVTTLATVWGMDLALVIYLLTAKDTDKLLAHIDALQDQLSAALEGPGPDAMVVGGEAAPHIDSTTGASAAAPEETHQPVEIPAGTFHGDEEIPAGTFHGGEETVPPEVPTEPARTPEAQHGPTPKAHPHPSHSHGTTPVPHPPVPHGTLVPPSTPEPLPVTEYMPKEYVEALRNQLRMEAEDFVRAWTPNPNGNGPWVVEDAKGDRWSVFQGRHDRPTVISLESRERLRQIRDEKQGVRQKLRDENQQLRRQMRDEEQQRVRAAQDARTAARRRGDR